MNVDFKNFRDNKTKLLISYWIMNKGQSFTTCNLSKTGLKLGNDNQILDFGCTFPTTGSYTIQENDSEVVTTVYAGESVNRRPLTAITITALEDNCRWCYSLHVNSLFTSNAALELDWDCPNAPKVLHGEQLKISADEVLSLNDIDKDLYIVNPIYGSEENTISYKFSDDENFNSLNVGKYLKIEKDNVCEIKSTVDTYIPKVYFDDSVKPFADK